MLGKRVGAQPPPATGAPIGGAPSKPKPEAKSKDAGPPQVDVVDAGPPNWWEVPDAGMEPEETDPMKLAARVPRPFLG